MPFELKIAVACVVAIVLALTGCTAVPNTTSAEIKKCEGTSSQRLRESKNQRYEVSKCKM